MGHWLTVGLLWPSKRSAALQRLPIQLGMLVLAARCAWRSAPVAARSLRHLTDGPTLFSFRSSLSVPVPGVLPCRLLPVFRTSLVLPLPPHGSRRWPCSRH